MYDTKYDKKWDLKVKFNGESGSLVVNGNDLSAIFGVKWFCNWADHYIGDFGQRKNNSFEVDLMLMPQEIEQANEAVVLFIAGNIYQTLTIRNNKIVEREYAGQDL